MYVWVFSVSRVVSIVWRKRPSVLIMDLYSALSLRSKKLEGSPNALDSLVSREQARFDA